MNNSVVHGEINKASDDDSHYSCFHPFCLALSSLLQAWACWFQRALFLRAGCTRCMWRCTGRTAWGKICLCLPLSSFSLWLFSLSVLFPVVPVFLLASLRVLHVSLFFFARTFSFSGFSDPRVWLRGEAFTVWHRLRMHSKEWVISFYFQCLCTPSAGDSFSRGQLIPQSSILLPELIFLDSWTEEIITKYSTH